MNKEKLLFEDFKDLKITEDTRNNVLTHQKQFSNSDVRIRIGKFYTDEELEKKLEQSLNTPLPEGKTLTKTK